jgi:hypothetical protein
MTRDEQLMVQMQSERLRELEGWLAMLIVRHGEFNGSGWQYTISHHAADIMRAAMPREDLVVGVDYDFAKDQFTLNAL